MMPSREEWKEELNRGQKDVINFPFFTLSFFTRSTTFLTHYFHSFSISITTILILSTSSSLSQKMPKPTVAMSHQDIV